MSRSINVVFIKQNKNETYGSLYVRTIENSVVARKSHKIKLSENHFERYFNTETKRFRNNKQFPEGLKYNDTIDEFFKSLHMVGNDLELLPDNRKSFLKYWKQFIETTDNHGTIIKHQVIYNKLVKYLATLSKTDLLFIDITPFFIRELRLHLQEAKDPKGLSHNTIEHYLKVI